MRRRDGAGIEGIVDGAAVEETLLVYLNDVPSSSATASSIICPVPPLKIALLKMIIPHPATRVIRVRTVRRRFRRRFLQAIEAIVKKSLTGVPLSASQVLL